MNKTSKQDDDVSCEQSRPEKGLGSQIAELFSGMGLDKDIPELRGYRVIPLEFD